MGYMIMTAQDLQYWFLYQIKIVWNIPILEQVIVDYFVDYFSNFRVYDKRKTI